jgi:hypothetical protein
MKIKLVVFGVLLVTILSLVGCSDGRRDYGGYGGYGYPSYFGYDGFGGERFRGFHDGFHGGGFHGGGFHDGGHHYRVLYNIVTNALVRANM